MAKQKIKKTCPVCYGTGKPTGDQSVSEIVTGYCYKCGGSGEITAYIEVPSTPSKAAAAAGASAGIGLSSILGWIVALPFLCVFAIIGGQVAEATDNVLVQILAACIGTIIVFGLIGGFFGMVIAKIKER